MTASSEAADTTKPKSVEHKRSKNGCQTCRNKRKKCDETRPRCQRCVRTSSSCHWPSKVRFRYQNISVPSDQTRSSDPDHFDLRIDDVIEESPPAQIHLQEQSATQGDGSAISVTHEIPASAGDDSRNRHHGQTLTPASSSSNTIYHHPSSSQTTHSWTTSNAPYQTSRLGVDRHDSDIAAPFLPTRSTFNYTSPQDSYSVDRSVALPSPDVLTDDGIFLPGSTYQELHLALRSQIFQTSQSRPNSRRQSLNVREPTTQSITSSSIPASPGDLSDSPSTGSSTPPELTSDQEVLLWDNWINEIGPWLDKFDHQKHHQHTLPGMAQDITHLKYSMLALSARQLERKTKVLPTATSLSLYQWAIHLLLPCLHTKSIPVLASCVILCVFEMSSCSPKAWRRHLDGCASLIMSMDIRGDSGGLAQSLFWCFARMDVCGGLISSEHTLIPTDKWYSTDMLSPSRFSASTLTHFEDYAGLSCYLLARVLKLLNSSRTRTSSAHRRSGAHDTNLVEEWKELFGELTVWQLNLPAEMRPVMAVSSSMNNMANPFPIIIYTSGAAISGNQAYHTAVLLMLQSKPRNVPVESRSMLWHARQICGISMSNSHHGAWTNSVQPLWIAGQLMSHPCEHRAIVELYAKIERETGWGASWRAADLQQHWGDLT